MIERTFFYSGMAFLFVHEMDAIRCREWKILPGLSALGDRTGLVVFSLLHVPLFVLLFLGLYGSGSNSLAIGLEVFCVLHGGLHLGYIRHHANEFVDWLSWSIISGAAVCGLAGLFLRLSG